jgi:hypothetical protein
MSVRYPHMAGFLRKLFGKSPAAQPASLAADRDAFLRQLGEQDIFVIAAMQGDGIDPKGMTKEQLLAEIERAAKDLNEDKAREPFVYEKDGQRRLPFFTSNDYAQTLSASTPRSGIGSIRSSYSVSKVRCWPISFPRVTCW